MKLLTFEHRGRIGYGAVVGDGVVDFSQAWGGRFPTLKALLAGQGLADARALLAQATASIALANVTYLPPIPDPAKILAIGLNYAAHAAEGGHPVPAKPVVFTRFADSLVGHGQPMVRPRESERFDFEVELGVVIGRPARRVAARDALNHVAGYTIVNEGSVRDWQRHTPQWVPGKNFHHSGAVGPWLVTADEIPDPSGLRVTTRLNGEVMQDSDTSDLIFDVPTLIEYITAFTPLAPGDLIATGTPSGVGNARTPPIYMKPGDTIELEIAGIGILRNPIVAD